ncbi:hypothetical protein PLEOSDRAFT_175903 [Pleurotus ostreatus PC15]|uniref:Cytochrome P450 monooxygenase n=1 Tax=Pleurotus ostreatus (strain PC15) TaxID=1137138 RepID=A0A067NNU7_PLEO1|nr:hypothetical protein PLEOSDRAFT_175903 [Pleurotus ostreatus PC15]
MSPQLHTLFFFSGKANSSIADHFIGLLSDKQPHHHQMYYSTIEKVVGWELSWPILLFVFVASLFVVTSRPDPFSDIPGPILARWTPLWLAYQARRGRRYQVVDELHKRYGRFVRIAPNHISVADKDALPIVYGQGHRAFDKSPFYHAFIGDKPSVFSTTDRQDHAQKRKLVSQAFSYGSLLNLTPLISAIVSSFVEKLDKISESGEYIDALVWFNYLAFDLLSDLAFGEPIGMVEKGSDAVVVEKADGETVMEHAISLVDEREHLAAVVGHHPTFRFLSKFLPDPFFVRGHRASHGLEDLARRRVMKRIRSNAHRDDILGRLIHARIGDGGSLTADQTNELIAESVTLLIAGSDTTSNSLTAILHLLLTHPDDFKRLYTVLEEAVEPGELPRYHQVKDIPLLDATIDEGLRLHATTAIGLHRSVPDGGILCCGRFFPASTEMSVPAWTIQHDKSIWNDPENFRPQRWLDNPDLRRYLMTFGKGPRACLGRNLAYMEMRLVLSTIILRYDMELQTPHMETTEGFMHKPKCLMTRFRRRNASP